MRGVGVPQVNEMSHGTKSRNSRLPMNMTKLYGPLLSFSMLLTYRFVLLLLGAQSCNITGPTACHVYLGIVPLQLTATVSIGPGLISLEYDVDCWR